MYKVDACSLSPLVNNMMNVEFVIIGLVHTNAKDD